MIEGKLSQARTLVKMSLHNNARSHGCMHTAVFNTYLYAYDELSMRSSVKFLQQQQQQPLPHANFVRRLIGH